MTLLDLLLFYQYLQDFILRKDLTIFNTVMKLFIDPTNLILIRHPWTIVVLSIVYIIVLLLGFSL